MAQVLEKLTRVNNQRSECPFKIDQIEAHYGAKFVGMLPIRDRAGNWGTSSISIFYQPEPMPGHSHYFGLHGREDKTYICDGSSAVEGNIVGAVAKDGEIVYSSGRWDMRHSTDQSVFIDGGRDYTKTNTGNLVEMVIVAGDFYQVINVVDSIQALP